MTRRASLLEHFLRQYPFQPATAYWRAVEIDAVLSQPPLSGRVLDLGCGDGKLTAIIESHWPGERRWVGVDPDALEARAALDAGIYETVHVALGDALPAPDGSMDAVFSNSVLEHIPDVGPVVSEVARVLRPGGRFLFTVPAATFHSALAGPLVGRDRERYLRAMDARLAHYYYLAPAGWNELLANYGLKLRHAEPFLTLRQTQRWEMLSRLTGGLLHQLSGSQLRPIEIQRALGLRKGREKMPPVLARMLMKLLAGPINDDVLGEEPYGCLLVDAHRPESLG